MSRSLKTRPCRPKTTPRRSDRSESSKSFSSSRVTFCFAKSTPSSFLKASESCAAAAPAASSASASAASARQSFALVFDMGERSFPRVRRKNNLNSPRCERVALLILARRSLLSGADEARDAVGNGLGHLLLPGFVLNELGVRRTAQDDHLDGDDGHVREDRAGERAALLAPDFGL